MEKIIKPTNILQGLEDERSVIIQGEMYDLLEQLTRRMRLASSVSQTVGIALELLVKAEGKEIVLMEQGRVVTRYNLWK